MPGTPRLAIDGKLPSDIAGQADLAWPQIIDMLALTGMTVHVKVTHYLLRPEDIPAYVEVRTGFLEDARPAPVLLVSGFAVVSRSFLQFIRSRTRSLLH